MKTQTKLALLALLSLSFIFSACEIEDILDGLEDVPIEQGAAIPAVDDVVLDEMRIQNLPGLAVAIIQNDVVTHIKAYGHQDEDRQIPATRETLFRWASISKTFTGVMAMRLYEAGHLDLDKDIRDYLPVWSANNPTITMRQLLSHTAGIPGYSGVSNWATNRNNYLSNNPNSYNAVAALSIFSGATMQNPGSYNYSTFGTMVAGAVIDQIGRNVGWGDYTSQAIALADSLNMASMEPDRANNTPATETDGFDISCSGALNNIENEEDIIYKLPGGGFRSNIKDMVRFCRAMVKQELLADTTWNLMNTTVSTSGSFGYGLCTEHFSLGSNNYYYGHGGVQSEARTQMYFYPNHGTAIMFLSPSNHTFRDRLRSRIAQALGLPVTPGSYNLQTAIGCHNSTNCLSNSDYRFAGVWEQGTEDQTFRRGLTTNAFNVEWTKITEAGYRLTDLEAWTDDDGVRRWDGVFTAGTGDHALWRNFNQTDFKTKWDEMTAQGMHLIDLETYESNGTRLWAGVFREASGGSALWRNFNTADFNAKWQEMSDAGYRLIDLETYVDGSTRKWAGAFVEGTGGYAMFRNYNTADFGTKRTEMQNQGLKLIDVETYTSGSTRLWAGVWRADTKQELLNRNYSFCGFLDRDSTWRTAGNILMDYEGYE
jgi:CubicO group peptidase (beta-lactamase class C family)